MGDPTNRNDPEYSQDPHYVWSGGRWQYVQDRSAQPDTKATSVTGTTTGTGDLSPLPARPAAGDTEAAMRGNAAIVRGVNALPMFNNWDARFKSYGAQAPVANPYNTATADQTRAAQLALIQQMSRQMNGPSIANMQGQRAMGQMGQQALMQGGRTGMLGAQGGSAGLAGDVGQARLAEVMRAQAGMGGVAGGLRGADQRSAEAQAQAALGANRLTAGRQQFALGQGTGLAQTELRNALENYKFGKRVSTDVKKRETDAMNQALDFYANGIGTMLKFAGG
jgi:hypothetical protein